MTSDSDGEIDSGDELFEDVHQEYSVIFDTWEMQCARHMLAGLILGQRRGGIQLVSFSVAPTDDLIEAVIDYYGNADTARIRMGYRYTLSRLSVMAGDDDPASAGTLYLEDMFTAPLSMPGDPVDGVHWITRP
ncbi:hypothetical protein [Rhodococcus sp. HNM0569]|uniref:hypothetical protein n=1 Tax=Rhodococcus sp. HNM0569 TaxID=2716340 RepID=UPI00146AE079|nr:hypothetical protein [Rhodococcus sp. HNM0569]NLU82695.1 hypothetical protein [Rhodococcus sp. HNM0569]